MAEREGRGWGLEGGERDLHVTSLTHCFMPWDVQYLGHDKSALEVCGDEKRTRGGLSLDRYCFNCSPWQLGCYWRENTPLCVLGYS